MSALNFPTQAFMMGINIPVIMASLTFMMALSGLVIVLLLVQVLVR